MVDVHEGVEEFVLPGPASIGGGSGGATPEAVVAHIGYDAAACPRMRPPRRTLTAEHIGHDAVVWPCRRRPRRADGRLQQRLQSMAR